MSDLDGSEMVHNAGVHGSVKARPPPDVEPAEEAKAAVPASASEEGHTAKGKEKCKDFKPRVRVKQ